MISKAQIFLQQIRKKGVKRLFSVQGLPRDIVLSVLAVALGVEKASEGLIYCPGWLVVDIVIGNGVPPHLSCPLVTGGGYTTRYSVT